MTNHCSIKKANKPERIGLALGSGSARGWAHLGVIKALSEAGIHIDYIAGSLRSLKREQLPCEHTYKEKARHRE